MDWQNDNGIFLPMLNDEARLDFYETAIARVANGKTFADVGAGTGLLSYLAAKNGAKKVYAIERDLNRFNLLCKVIDSLNLAHIIEPIHADFLTLNLVADYCVTETIGCDIFDEDILDIGKHAKQLGMIVIPERMELSLLVQKAHPIFYLSVREHTQNTFQLSDRLSNFGNIVSNMIEIDHAKPLERNDFFPVSRALPEIKLEDLYTSPAIPFILGESYDHISLTLPAEYAVDQALVNIVWEAKFENIIMNQKNTNWGNPSKRVVMPNKSMTFTYKDHRWWYNP